MRPAQVTLYIKPSQIIKLFGPIAAAITGAATTIYVTNSTN